MSFKDRLKQFYNKIMPPIHISGKGGDMLPAQATPRGAFSDKIYGRLTQQRPQNYYGNAFVTPEMIQRMNGIDLPRREHLDYLEDNILPQTRQAGIPDALVAGQWAEEGGRNINPAGFNWWGAGGTNPISYPSMESSTRNYIQTIRENSGLSNFAGRSPEEILELIQYIYEQSQPEGVYRKNVTNTPEWRFYR